jgi:hypothetical protein
MLAHYPHIPPQAFLFFPPPEFCREGDRADTTRWVFMGAVAFSPYETQKLEELARELSSKKLALDAYWHQGLRLRFLQANKFDPRKTVEAMVTHMEWRRSALPPLLNPRQEQLLQAGGAYTYGRDRFFRPLIVLDLAKCNPESYSEDELAGLVTFFFEFMLREVMLEGQVENWFVLMDLNGQGITSLAGLIKRLVGILSNNYRCRLVSMYLVNAPTSVFWGWKMISGLLDERTARKISISNQPL